MALTVTGFQPNHGEPGDEITVYGTEFARGVKVLFRVDSEGYPVSVQSPDQLTVTVPLAAVTGTIRVNKPSTGEQAVSPASFTVDQPPPVQIIRFSPESGQTGQQVTIYGDGFHNTMAVMFGTFRATTIRWESEMKIVATVPNNANRGSVYIRVGAAQSKTQFRIT